VRRGFRGHRGNSRRWHGRRSPSRGLGGGFLRFFFGFGGSFGLRFRFGHPLDPLANLFRNVGRNRARMRLLFRDAILGQQVNNGLGLDLKLPGQLVDSDLIRVGHALRRYPKLRFGLFRVALF
jgi:hypothetical protein